MTAVAATGGRTEDEVFAIAWAGVILASLDPRSVLSVIQLSRVSYRK